MEGEGSPPRRVLLKLSGEALMGGRTHGVDPDIAGRIAAQLEQHAARRRWKGRARRRAACCSS